MLYLVMFFLILLTVCYFWIGVMKVIGLYLDDQEVQEKHQMWAIQLEHILENQAKEARNRVYTSVSNKF